jgi:hypothetical protein
LYDAITPQDFFARLLPPTEIVVDFRVEELEKLYIILGVKINLDKYSV